ncbi:MAG: transporter substrate-binding domain-containing protein [Vulcanimicrobiaceae bacterium]
MNVSRLAFSAMLGCALVGPMVATASAKDTMAEIKQRGKLVVGVKQDYRPYGFLDPSGKIVGLEPDLAADVAKRLGVTLELVPVIASNRMQFLQQGRIDLMIATMTDTPARRAQVDIVQPDYYAAGVNVLAKKGAGLTSWQSLKGKPLCAVQGAFYNKQMQDEYGAQVLAFPGTSEALNALKAGNCIAFVYDDSFNNPTSQLPEYAGFDTPLPSIEVKPWGLAVAKDEPQFATFMSNTVKDWFRTGLIIELDKKYKLPVSDFDKQMHEEYSKKK